MDYLLDTHALLSALTAPEKLGEQARAVIDDPRTALLVSSANAWEVATKDRLGKLGPADALVSGFSRHVARLGARSLLISAEHALLAGSLGWAHRDPFDRMIAAQCMLESLTLISKDPAFGDVAGIRTLW